MSIKEKLLLYCNARITPSTALNRMGCNESWYDSFYAMSQTFSVAEIAALSDEEVERLLRLAENIQENLY